MHINDFREDSFLNSGVLNGSSYALFILIFFKIFESFNIIIINALYGIWQVKTAN